MYKYSYKKIRCNFNGIGLLSGNSYEIENYQEVIKEKAAQGWRYIGFMPTKQRGTGHIEELDLIFEKEIEESNNE